MYQEIELDESSSFEMIARELERGMKEIVSTFAAGMEVLAKKFEWEVEFDAEEDQELEKVVVEEVSINEDLKVLAEKLESKQEQMEKQFPAFDDMTVYVDMSEKNQELDYLEEKVKENEVLLIIEENSVNESVEREFKEIVGDGFSMVDNLMMVDEKFVRKLEFDTGERSQSDPIMEFEAENGKRFMADSICNDEHSAIERVKKEGAIGLGWNVGLFDVCDVSLVHEIKKFSVLRYDSTAHEYDSQTLNINSSPSSNWHFLVQINGEQFCNLMGDVFSQMGIALLGSKAKKILSSGGLVNFSSAEAKESFYANMSSSFWNRNGNSSSYYSIIWVKKNLKGYNALVSQMSQIASKSCIHRKIAVTAGWMHFAFELFWEAKSDQPVLFRFSFDPGGNEHSDIKKLQPTIFSFYEVNIEPLKDAMLSDISVSISAAPTYLPAHYIKNKDDKGNEKEFSLIDGGVAANTRALVAISEVIRQVLEQNPDIFLTKPIEIDPFLVLSIETGLEKSKYKYYNTMKEAKWGDFGRPSDLFTSHPVKALQGFRIKQIAGGDSHCLAVTMKGEMQSWGRHHNGQLGLGTIEDSILPQKIKSFQGISVKMVATGAEHLAIVTEDNDLYGRGLRTYGNLGLGDRNDHLVPPNSFSTKGERMVLIACGWRHTIVVCPNGGVYTYGWNKFGQVGAVTFAVTENHNVFSWGSGTNGQLGDEESTDRNLSTIVKALRADGSSRQQIESANVVPSTGLLSISFDLTSSCGGSATCYFCWKEVLWKVQIFLFDPGGLDSLLKSVHIKSGGVRDRFTKCCTYTLRTRCILRGWECNIPKYTRSFV